MSEGERIVPFSLYADLLGLSFDRVNRCWGLCVEVFRRFGLHVAGDGTDVFDPVATPEAGDLVMLAPADGATPHAGVYLGSGRVLHTASVDGASVASTRLDALQRADKVKGFYRHSGQHHEPTPPLPAHPEDIIIAYLADVTQPFRRSICRVRWVEGQKIGQLIPPGANLAVLGGQLVGLDEVRNLPSQPGSCLVFGTFPGWPQVIALGIGLILSFLSSLFLPALPSTKNREDQPGSPTFDLTGLKNTALVGIAQPLLYGEHRVGGNFIHAFQKSDDQGRSILYLMMLVSRGPIQSIAGLTADADDLTGNAIPVDIEIDGSPAKNYNAAVSIRLGGSEQTAMPGFNELTTTTGYQKVLLAAATGGAPDPFTHETTDEVDGFDLIINYPVGLFNIDTTNGNVEKRSVAFNVRYRKATEPTSVSTWATPSVFQHTDARRSARTRQITIKNLTLAKYIIQIDRFVQGVLLPTAVPTGSGTFQTTAGPWPEVESDKESQSVLIGVNEINSQDALWYPGKALVGIRVIATNQLSGNLPTITVKAKGLKVWVWDGVSETSPAFGTAKVWSDNPAWCVLNMLLDPNHGMHRNARLRLNNIGLSEFKTWADNCDVLVSDGRGSTTKRATFDYVIDEVKKGWEFIASLALSHWARLFIAGNEIRVVTEKVATPVAMLNMGNLKDVSIAYKGKRHRPNVVEVSYINEEANYEQDVVVWPPGGTIASGDPIVKETVQAVGVTRACQAYRLAHWRWNLHNLIKRVFEGTTGVENIHLVPGDVANVQHEVANQLASRTSGRVLASGASSITLDHDLTITSGTNKITVRTKGSGADVLQERTLTNGTYARGAVIATTSGWNGGDLPALGDPYMAGPVNAYYLPFRLMAIETTPATLERRLQGTEYADALYDDDPGDVETFTDQVPDPRKIPDPVTDISLTEVEARAADGSVQDFLRVEWTPAALWDAAEVWWRMKPVGSSGGEWLSAGKVTGDHATIGPFGRFSQVQVSITPVSKQGTRPAPDFGTQKRKTVIGSLRRPSAPAGVVAEVIGGNLAVKITPPEDVRSIVGYEIRYGSTWGGSILLARRVASEWNAPLQFLGTQTIRVRSLSRSGLLSADEAIVDIEVNVHDTIYRETNTRTEEPAWADTKADTVEDSDSLVLDSADVGTYDVDVTPAGGVRRVFIGTTCGLRNVVRQGNEFAVPANDPIAAVPANACYLTGFEISGRKTGASLRGVPAEGLVGRCLTGWGVPIDILAGLTPSLTVNTGAGAEEFHGIERNLTTIEASLTLRRPHERYEPESTAMTTSLQDYI